MSFENNYLDIISIIKNDIEKTEKFLETSVEEVMPLSSSVSEFLSFKSKRIRSVLTILYLKALGLNLKEEHYELFSVIELVHNASLIHDDVVDNCNLRRNNETLNCKFGNKLAVLGGDYVLSLAMNKLVYLGQVDILRMFTDTFKSMCIGEINQNYNRFKITSIEQYIEKTKLKTANLFKTALESALFLSGIEKNEAEEFAINFGIAFQIRDDLQNVICSQKAEKPINNDIESGIYNAPIILAEGKDNLKSGIEKTYFLLNNYINNAKEFLTDLPDNVYKKAIIKLIEELNNV